MRVEFFRGFGVVNFGENKIKFVVPHSSLSWEFIPRGDIGSDLLAVHLAKEFRTKAIISLLPKEGNCGINFNRLCPDFESARRGFEYYEKERFGRIYRFYLKYAFTANSLKDYKRKLAIYNSFWKKVSSFIPNTSLFVFLHTQSSMLKNLPSLIDITTYRSISKTLVESVIEEINKRYRGKFKKIKREFLEYSALTTKFFFYNSIRQKFGVFDPRKFDGAAKEFWERCVKRARELNVRIPEKSLKGLMKAIRSVKITPRITFEMNFQGRYSQAPKKYLKGRRCLQLEVSSFLTETMPDFAEEVILELLKRLEGYGLFSL